MSTQDTSARLPVRVTFYFDPEGTVTICDLFEPVLPFAQALAPDNPRLKAILAAREAWLRQEPRRCHTSRD